MPVVLSIDEVKTLLGNTPNLKHKTLLSLLYSFGLRIGEAIHLKLRYMDLNSRFMHIKSGKSAKERYVPISGQMIILLRRYQLAYQPREYVFEGQQGDAYAAVSARQVLTRALKSSIQKTGTLHALRHSHATHLLENGTDLRYIDDFWVIIAQRPR